MKISIRTNILIVFLLGVFFIASTLLIAQYYFSTKIALESTQKEFLQTAKSVAANLELQKKHIQKLMKILSQDKTYSIKELHSFMELNNQIKSIYFANSKGDFFEFLHLDADDVLLLKYAKNTRAKWMKLTIEKNTQSYSYYDENLNFLNKYSTKKQFDVLKRKWYTQALLSDKIIFSKPYRFALSNERGVTYSKKITPDKIVGIDYRLQKMGDFLLANQFNTSTELFVLDKNKNIVVFPKKGMHLDPSKFQKLQTNKIILSKEGKEKFYEMLLPLDNGDYLLIRLDAKELLAPYKKNTLYALLLACFLVLLFLPFVFMSTSRLVRPIQALIVENEKIKQRNFAEVKELKTNIVEFEALSHSLYTMAQSIQAYQKSQADLLDAIIKLIAEAIDAKSPYTGGHCERVPEIATLLLQEANRAKEGELKDFHLTSEEALKEFNIAAWLHDCGKVTTPEYVVDKATKLETIYNRIHEIRTRFEVLLRDAKIEELQGKISYKEFEEKKQKLQNDFAFIAEVNLGSEFMDEEKIAKVKEIAKYEWMRNFSDRLGLGELELQRFKNKEPMLPVKEKLLSDKLEHIVKREHFDDADYKAHGFKEEVPKHLYNYGEVYNLCIQKGTLTPEERYKIDEHVIMSIKMLEKIPFPPYYAKIPEYAGNHHETLDGKGYPRKLTKKELSIPARIMAIADIFEALTASDRPYKKAKTLSESLKIMSFMAKEEHIDKELFALFLRSGVYKVYAEKYLKKEQLDRVNIENLL